MLKTGKIGRAAAVAILSLMFWAGGPAWSQSLFLSPDTVRVFSGGTESFPLELRADAAVTGMSLYSVRIAFDKTLLAVDSVVEGHLLSSCGTTVQFYARFNTDSTELIIESLIIWPRCSVNGPGLLATIYLRNIGNGVYDFAVNSVEVRDVMNDLIPGVTGRGSMLYLNAPPDAFDLLQPTDGQLLNVDVGESITFVWDKSVSFYPGDVVRYDLSVSHLSGFPLEQTTTYANLADTAAIVVESALWEGTIYWRVRSYSVLHGFARFCNQPYLTFTLNINKQPPSAFGLLAPTDDTLVNIVQKDHEDFGWTAATSVMPNDTLRYAVYVGQGAGLPGDEDFVLSDIESTGTAVDVDSFDVVVPYYWRVRCTNRYGLSSWSDEVFGIMFYMRGDANSDGKINVGDAVMIVTYVFRSGPAPNPSIAGDANCDDKINIGDAVYIVSYVFRGGPPPCAE